MKKRIITMVAAIMTLLTLSFSMVACSSPSTNDSSKANTPTQETILAGGMQVGEVQNYGIKLMSANIEPASYEDYGIATVAETAMTINATITPSEAANHGIDWSIQWTNPSSTWANGKDVTSYVTISPSSNSKTLTVSCLQAFGQQITVKATSQDNPDITATCTLEYAQKVTAASLNIGNIPVNFGGSTEIKYEICPTVIGSGGVITANVTTNDVYTIAEAFTKTVAFSVPSDTEQWFNVKDLYPTGMALTDWSITNWHGKEYYFDYQFDMVNWMIMQRAGDILFKNLTTAQIIDYMSNITCPNIATITLTLTGAHNTYTYSSQLVCTGYTNSTPVNSLDLDTTNYIF